MKINTAFLPEMQTRVERAVEAAETIEEMFARCLQEGRDTQTAFSALRTRHTELGQQLKFLESRFVGLARDADERERARLQAQMAQVQRRTEEVRRTMVELGDRFQELTLAMEAIQGLSARSPEVAQA